MRLFILNKWALVIFLLFFGCEQTSTNTPSGNVIQVGIIAPFSGSDFAKGEEGLRGVQTALVMRPLLDNGDKIELVIKDDQNNPALSTKALAELTDSEKVAAVVTFSSSGPVLAMAKKANDHQTPIVAALATHPEVTKSNNYVSQTCFDNSFQGHVAAFFVRDDLLVDRVAVFKTPTSFYSSNLANEFESQFTALSGSVTDVFDIREGETEYADILARVRLRDPELLYMPLAAKEAIAITQAIDKMGWKPRKMASDGLLATVISQHAQHLDHLDGMLATDFFHYDSLGTNFGKRASKAHKGEATSYTAMGVEAFSILLEAMNHCDEPSNRACINRQIRSTTDFEGLMGKITIDATGKAHRPIIINSIKNGRLEYIVKVY
jgi:branched-chain amino acid transport system substrate-binding protein